MHEFDPFLFLRSYAYIACVENKKISNSLFELRSDRSLDILLSIFTRDLNFRNLTIHRNRNKLTSIENRKISESKISLRIDQTRPPPQIPRATPINATRGSCYKSQRGEGGGGPLADFSTANENRVILAFHSFHILKATRDEAAEPKRTSLSPSDDREDFSPGRKGALARKENMRGPRFARWRER